VGGNVKYLILIIDGASGWPVAELGGLTSLEAARTPHLDRLAREGIVGRVQNVPKGMEPSSAVACMSVLGFDPRLYYAGRGPIEALSMGIELRPGEAALRCNFVTVRDGIMVSHSAGQITSAESHRLIHVLSEELADGRVAFHPGLGYRHLVTVRDGQEFLVTACTPAHDIPGQGVADHLPRGPEAALLLDLMERSKPILAAHPVNRERDRRGELPATQIWLFWPGLEASRMPSFKDAYGYEAALTSAVDLLKGLARQASIEVLEIAGVTDGGDNDYAGQMRGGLEALEERDVVFIHVEAPDEAGHSGDAGAKVQAIERIDESMVAQALDRDDLRLLVLPDHPTPLALRTHSEDPVPFVIWGLGVRASGVAAYTERLAEEGPLVQPGHSLLHRLFRPS
jgi:2,3-bisphosphoglycerate-independent phosphoglycerate mutase